MRVYTIGRDRTCDYVVDDAKVSRTHLQIVVDDNGVVSVVDLNSRNGTYVNGAPISGVTRLNIKDELRAFEVKIPWQEIIGLKQDDGSGSKTQPKNSGKGNLVWLIMYAVVLIVSVAVCWWIASNKNSEIEQVKQQSAVAQKALEEKNKELEEQIENLEAECGNLSDQLQELAASKDKEIDNLVKVRKNLQADIKELEGEKDALVIEKSMLEGENEVLEEDKAELQEKVDSLNVANAKPETLTVTNRRTCTIIIGDRENKE